MSQDPFLYRLVDAFHALKLPEGADCARWIGVPIVGADDEAVLPRVLYDVRNIVIGLARDEDVVLFKKVLRQIPSSYAVADRHFAVDPGYPLGGGLDKPPVELGNCSGNSLINRLKHAVTVGTRN